MSERTVLEIANPVTQTVETLTQQLIAKYPTGFLFDIETPVSAPILAEMI